MLSRFERFVKVIDRLIDELDLLDSPDLWCYSDDLFDPPDLLEADLADSYDINSSTGKTIAYSANRFWYMVIFLFKYLTNFLIISSSSWSRFLVTLTFLSYFFISGI
jgi:hypothetical protein